MELRRGSYTKVLDHGYVKLIDFMGNDESIVEAARMSTGRGFISWDPYARCNNCDLIVTLQNGEVPAPVADEMCATAGHKWTFFHNGDLGLLDTLWRKKHATPFEMGELVIEVQAPIFVFREWHRHRTQSYNEFSARYSVMPNIHYLPNTDRVQKQGITNKQGSGESLNRDDAEFFISDVEDTQERIYSEYEEAIGKGISRELARINTPVSRYSKMRAKGNLRNWFQFLNLRMRPDAQYEIREYANKVAEIIDDLWPKSYALFEEYDLYGVHLSNSERAALYDVLQRLRSYMGAGSYDAFVKGIAESNKLTGSKLREFTEKLADGGTKIFA